MAFSLGGYTFAVNPANATLPVKRRMGLPVETLTGVEMFSWGVIITGAKITLEWEFIPTAEFDSLEALYVADAVVAFNPENGHTYNVEILSLEGAYHLYSTNVSPYRKDVKMELMIIAQVT
jgi:hypothetical protein